MAETRIRLDKQIQKAPAVNMIPLSDANGELQFANLGTLIKTGETQTALNSVEISGGNLIIKYTPENGIQQVVSTALNYSQTDIKINDAKLENPSAGVYRLLITETDGQVYPVDLSALLAVVTQNTTYLNLSGNGTPQSPLRIDLSQAFWDSLPKTLDAMDDVTIQEEWLMQEVTKGGAVVLVWDYEMQQWVPRSINNFEPFKEITHTYRDLVSGNTVELAMELSKVVPDSIKVYRNGLRQDYGVDYEFGQQGGNQIRFFEPFTDRFPEKVVVDYRPVPLYLSMS